MSAPIQIVDENDQPIAVATKQEAWDKGLRHRVVRIMIENDEGKILLQHRTPAKDIFPNCWDNSCTGHVDAGEDYDESAVRELAEELDIHGVVPEEIGNYASDEMWKGHHFKRFARVYRLRHNSLPTKLEVGKIDDARWFTLDEVRTLVKEHPDKVT